MKFIAKKTPNKPGFYLINTDDTGLSRPLLVYCEGGRYTYGSPEEISDLEKSVPLEELTKKGFWRFWGPINPIGATA